MQIAVLVERVKGDGYRARGKDPFAVSAKAATREEALAKLRAKIQTRLKNGTEIVGLEISPQPDPWLEFAGMFRGDPRISDWKKIPLNSIGRRLTRTRMRYEFVRARHGQLQLYQTAILKSSVESAPSRPTREPFPL